MAVLMMPPDVQSAKIIAYPLDVYSHTYNFIRVGEELINRGHTFTLLLSNQIENKFKDKIHFPSLTYYSYLNDDITNYCIVAAIRDNFPPSNCSTLYGYQCINTSKNQDIILAMAQRYTSSNISYIFCVSISSACYILKSVDNDSSVC